MLITKDETKIKRVEFDFYNYGYGYDSDYFYIFGEPFIEPLCRPFEVADDSLIDQDIQKGDFLIWKEDFEPSKIDDYLFIVSLSNGDMMARFVEIIDSNEITLIAANDDFQDLTFTADEIEIVGVVTKIYKS